MTDSIDDNKCPLCGKINSCCYSKQSHSEQKSCWCGNTDYTFSVKLLARIPEKFKNKACICENCAHAYQKTDHPNDHPT